ncbi:MAG: hypothetical protein ACYDBQ_01145 [Thermoplasmatota archaeon]
MGVVSARLDDDDERILRRAKVNISETLRNAAHVQARRILALEALDRLHKLASPAKSRSQDLVRELRDG